MCPNIRHAGARHEQWYSKTKPCCMCGEHEDWKHIITCKSPDAELVRADAWSKVRKMMDKWSLSADTWTAIENGVRHYTQNPLKRDPDNMTAGPPSPFGTTLHTPRNRLKVVFRAQSKIGWENFLKRRLNRKWIGCIDHHFRENRSKLSGQECVTKLIMGLSKCLVGKLQLLYTISSLYPLSVDKFPR
jgi:hypothetical protein